LRDFGLRPLDLSFFGIKHDIDDQQHASFLTASSHRIPDLPGKRRSPFDNLELAKASARKISIDSPFANFDDNCTTSRNIARPGKAKA
jgi:hypothetical protein